MKLASPAEALNVVDAFFCMARAEALLARPAGMPALPGFDRQNKSV
jgi:hypothetical protein